MGNRFILDRMDKAGVQFYQLWARAHKGKYWKRQMHKARRKAWKQNRIEGTPDNKYESFCQFKGW